MWWAVRWAMSSGLQLFWWAGDSSYRFPGFQSHVIVVGGMPLDEAAIGGFMYWGSWSGCRTQIRPWVRVATTFRWWWHVWDQNLLPEIWNSLPYQFFLPPYCEKNGGTNHMPSLVHPLPWKSEEKDLINFDWAFWKGQRTCWHSELADVDSKKVTDWVDVAGAANNLSIHNGALHRFYFVWKKKQPCCACCFFQNSTLVNFFLNFRFTNALALTSTESVETTIEFITRPTHSS